MITDSDKLVQFKELALGSRLKRLSDQIMKEVITIYKELNVDFDPYHMPIFKLVSEQKKLSIGEISSLLKVTQPAVTQYVNSLIKKELIISKTNETDKRKRNISLTTNGLKLLDELKPIWAVIDDEVKKITHRLENKTLLDHITYVENELSKKSFSQTVIVKLKQ